MGVLKFLEKSVKIVDKYGWWKVLQAIFFAGLFISIYYYIPFSTRQTTKDTLNSVEKAKNEEHFRNIELRRELQPQIETTLNSLLTNCKSDRAFIIELHNGSNNINGVPFLHGSVTYEVSRDGLDMIDEDYQNISLSRFEMASYLHTKLEFVGSIDELRKIDKKMAAKLESNDVKYIVISTLHDGNREWGWFGVLYNRSDDIPTTKDLLNNMLIASQTITKEMNILKIPYDKF